MKNLQPGDIVQSEQDGIAYIVTDNYGDRVTAIRSIDITNPVEWNLICKTNADPAAVPPEKMDTIPFEKKAVKAYLDRNIVFWRERLKDSNVVADDYIDAYQSVRMTLFGETLPAAAVPGEEATA
jgi:hypothetical protein